MQLEARDYTLISRMESDMIEKKENTNKPLYTISVDNFVDNVLKYPLRPHIHYNVVRLSKN